MEFSHDSALHINHRYLLAFAERVCQGRDDPKILDYGCGKAEIVLAGRQQGLNIFGAEAFTGTSARQSVEAAGLLGSVVREIDAAGRLDFPDNSFDFVFSNQVMEDKCI
jgi:2-polyprenyl-3-methyl-5-hydroxy-6-metoxy-1,4-benzoquinol methylase